MKNLVVALLAVLAVSALAQQEKEGFKFSNIYRDKANARENIRRAIASAAQQDQRILLVFGANWCPWCQRLHHLFAKDKEIKAYLQKHYKVVLVNLGKRDRNMDIDAEYGNPNKLGLPALVVLDKEGRHIHSQETGALEFGKESPVKGHDPAKVLRFLKAWAIAP
jgi:thioredoxin-related protein